VEDTPQGVVLLTRLVVKLQFKHVEDNFTSSSSLLLQEKQQVILSFIASSA